MNNKSVIARGADLVPLLHCHSRDNLCRPMDSSILFTFQVKFSLLQRVNFLYGIIVAKYHFEFRDISDSLHNK